MADSTCQMCGEAFSARAGGKPQRYCSKRCYSTAATIRRREQYQPKPAACCVCGKPCRRYGIRAFCGSDECRRIGNRIRRAELHAVNPERQREANRAWYRKVGSQAWERYRTTRRIPVELRRYTTAQKIAARFDYFGHRCWICGCEAQERDHVKPLAKGGLHLPSNIRPICRACNRRKKDAWPYPPKS